MFQVSKLDLRLSLFKHKIRLTFDQKEPRRGTFTSDNQPCIVESQASKHVNLDSIKHSEQGVKEFNLGGNDLGPHQKRNSNNVYYEHKVIYESNLELQEEERYHIDMENEKMPNNRIIELSKITEENQRSSSNRMNHNSNETNNIYHSDINKNLNPHNLAVNSSDQIKIIQSLEPNKIEEMENSIVTEVNFSQAPKIIMYTGVIDPLYLNNHVRFCNERALAVINSSHLNKVNNSLTMLNNSGQQGLTRINNINNAGKLTYQKKPESQSISFVERQSRTSKGIEKNSELAKIIESQSQDLSSSKHIVRYRKVGNPNSNPSSNRNDLCLVKENTKPEVRVSGAQRFIPYNKNSSTSNGRIIDDTKEIFKEDTPLKKGNESHQVIKKDHLAQSININSKQNGAQNIIHRYSGPVANQYTV